MKDNGKMICNMDMVSRNGKMAPPTLELTLTGRNKELVSISGMMVPNTLENGMKTRYTEW